MKLQLPTTRKVRIEMLPLIDIVFLLLVFFIYAMLSMAVHRSLPVQLPSSTAAAIDKEAQVSVTVRADGSVFVDKEKIPIEALDQVLIRRVKDSPKAAVLLFGDRSVSYQRLFSVLDRIQKAGISKVSLQAEKESASP
ncbi:MAG: biopolymer transporter ExbD [Desulfobacterales bacterium]|jgi:biopolymer transport protein ExbD